MSWGRKTKEIKKLLYWNLYYV